MDLKTLYDAAMAADTKVKQLLERVEAANQEGTPEGEQMEHELLLALDEAVEDAKKANARYVSVRDAQATSDEAAKLFVPVPDPAATGGDNPKVMSRAAFDALDPDAKMSFIKSDGKIVD